jgi:hypothetical protein
LDWLGKTLTRRLVVREQDRGAHAAAVSGRNAAVISQPQARE